MYMTPWTKGSGKKQFLLKTLCLKLVSLMYFRGSNALNQSIKTIRTFF